MAIININIEYRHAVVGGQCTESLTKWCVLQFFLYTLDA